MRPSSPLPGSVAMSSGTYASGSSHTFRCLGCASGPAHRNTAMLEAGRFDQGAGSHVERRLKQAVYLIQQCLCLTQIFKCLTSVRVPPGLEQHKKVWSLDFLIGGEADRPVPAAEN